MRALPVSKTNVDSIPDRRQGGRRAADRFPIPALYDAWSDLKSGLASLFMLRQAWNFWKRLIATIEED
jgi:hypothetical protein